MVGRKGDITMGVCQNNERKRLHIETVTDTGTFEKILGYLPEELIGMPFQEILPQHIAENIADYIEFQDDGNDLVNVLNKSREFGLVSKSGETIGFSMRIQHDASPDKHPRYVIVMQAKKQLDAESLKMLETAKENAALDSVTQLPDRSSFLELTEVVHYYVEKGKVTASIAVIMIDDFDETQRIYGQDTGDGLRREVVLRCKQNFRESDLLGYLGGGAFAVILFGTSLENAVIPMNRLRWQVANQPLYIPGNEDVNATLSIAYKGIVENETVDTTIKNCEKILVENRGENQLFEA